MGQREPDFDIAANACTLSDENDAGVSSSEETDDPEVLALFEREEIVEKYERVSAGGGVHPLQGPEQDGIDPWENPNFDLHKKTDRFGFIQ